MRALQVMSEWFLDHDPGAFGIRANIQRTQFFCNVRNQLRSDGHIKNYIRMLPEFFFFCLDDFGNLLVLLFLFGIHFQVADVLGKRFPMTVWLTTASTELLNAIQKVCAILVICKFRPANTNDPEL